MTDLLYSAIFGGVALIVGVIVIAIGLAFYVWCSFITYRTLQSMNYDKAWMAWIPMVKNYALADVTKDEGENTRVLGAFEVPNWLYQWAWVIPLVLNIPGVKLPGFLEWAVSVAFAVIFLGTCYAKIFAWHDGVSEDDKRGIGIASGIFEIIAVIIMTGWKKEDVIERPAKIETVETPENNDFN
ncbi:MAG: hypothetical protein IJM28_04990 [Lachnospiraceae bacterium]|nr:hypothetical protein [Lachnospiraceae bacterium]